MKSVNYLGISLLGFVSQIRSFHLHLSSPPQKRRGTSFALRMAVTPVGPFCPFRSSASKAVEKPMERMQAQTPQFASELTSIHEDMQMGKTPDKEKLLRVASGMDETVEQWERLVFRLKISSDFQTREHGKLTQAHMEHHGVSTDGMASMLRWQSECMKAIAYNRPPPMPPADLDIAKVIDQGNNAIKKPPPLSAMLAARDVINTTPFTGEEPAFQSPVVREEYVRLCDDHANLIEFGTKYDTFDPLGKLTYLDEIEKVQERWDVFYARFSLMGALNKEYVAQCNTFLASMGLDESGFRKLLKDCHDIMRRDAEQERNIKV